MSTDFIVHENSGPASPPWDEVTRVCRRICVLRASGRAADAIALHSSDLAPLLAHLPPGPETDHHLQTLFAEEERRVADAHALVDILAPLLVEHLRTLLPSFATTAPTASAPAPAAAPPRPVRTTAPEIADFIEDMLSQQRPPRARAS